MLLLILEFSRCGGGNRPNHSFGGRDYLVNNFTLKIQQKSFRKRFSNLKRFPGGSAVPPSQQAEGQAFAGDDYKVTNQTCNNVLEN